MRTHLQRLGVAAAVTALVGLVVAAWALAAQARPYEREHYADAATRPRLLSPITAPTKASPSPAQLAAAFKQFQASPTAAPPHAAPAHTAPTNASPSPAQLAAAFKQQLQASPFVPKPPPTPDPRGTVTLLWSGGVASTFELCDRLLRRGQTVRPVHLTGASLDTRESALQERTTVEAMDGYLREHFPAATKGRLLSTVQYLRVDHDGEGADAQSKTKRPPTTREAVARALGVGHAPHQVSTFYVVVAALARSLPQRPPLNGRSRLVVVLPKDGPHVFLRFAVEAWGVPVDPRDPSRVVVVASSMAKGRRNRRRTSSPLERVYGVRAETADRRAFVSLYDRVEWVLPDRAPEGGDVGRRARAHQPPFEHVLRRAWSCRRPHLTQEQAERREANRLATLTMVPAGECKRCASCEQRKRDGLVRVR